MNKLYIVELILVATIVSLGYASEKPQNYDDIFNVSTKNYEDRFAFDELNNKHRREYNYQIKSQIPRIGHMHQKRAEGLTFYADLEHQQIIADNTRLIRQHQQEKLQILSDRGY